MEIIFQKLLEIEALVKKQYVLNKELLLLGEAAEYLGISDSAMYKLKRKNLIPFSQPGGKIIYFKRVDIESWVLNSIVASDDEVSNDVDKHLSRNLKS